MISDVIVDVFVLAVLGYSYMIYNINIELDAYIPFQLYAASEWVHSNIVFGFHYIPLYCFYAELEVTLHKDWG